MVNRNTRYQGNDIYERASSNAALAEQVQDELAEMYYSTTDDQQLGDGSIASLMGRSYEDVPVETAGEVELASRAEVPEPIAETLAAEAEPKKKSELSFLEKMVMNMRSMFS